MTQSQGQAFGSPLTHRSSSHPLFMRLRANQRESARERRRACVLLSDDRSHRQAIAGGHLFSNCPSAAGALGLLGKGSMCSTLPTSIRVPVFLCVYFAPALCASASGDFVRIFWSDVRGIVWCLDCICMSMAPCSCALVDGAVERRLPWRCGESRTRAGRRGATYRTPAPGRY